MIRKLLLRTRPCLARCLYTHRQYAGHPSLLGLGVTNPRVYRNMSPPELYEQAVDRDNNWNCQPGGRPTVISSTGALCAYSGTHTDQLLSERRIVFDDTTRNTVEWNGHNIKLELGSYKANWARALDYLNSVRRLYVMDGYLGWDPKTRMKIRIICERPYHALFARNMLIMPLESELQEFDRGADFTLLNAGNFNADPNTKGVGQKASIALNFTDRTMCILGSLYTGEMKKGLFTAMNYWMPMKGNLSIHASANEGVDEDVTLFIGSKGSGKTALSADPRRKLIGDDELVWTDDGLFNIEGGCYAQCRNLTRQKEPQIFDAIKFGTVLENASFSDLNERVVNFNDLSVTTNIRASYPLHYIPGAKVPASGAHPRNIILLTSDAYGVLPPVAKLTAEQAMYQFISGYSCILTEIGPGVRQPQPTFSACFGESFLPLDPCTYARLLKEKIKKTNADVWLLNTGWIGGSYPNGKRMSMRITRAIIDAIHFGELIKSDFWKLEAFGFGVPTSCVGVDPFILDPSNTWLSKAEYKLTINSLASQFKKNFEKFAAHAGEDVIRSGPVINKSI